MKYTVRAIFALLCAAILAMGCGGTPGSSGDSDSGDGTGAGPSVTPHMVTLPVTLNAGNATNEVASIAIVTVWQNTPDTPMKTMPVAFEDYANDPIEVDANDPDLVQVGLNLEASGFMIAIAPAAIVSSEKLQAVDTDFPIAATAARDVTGTWTCTQTLTQNGVVYDEQTKSSAIKMLLDQTGTACGMSIEAFGGASFKILGDQISTWGNDQPAQGTVESQGHDLNIAVDGVNGDAAYSCSR